MSTTVSLIIIGLCWMASVSSMSEEHDNYEVTLRQPHGPSQTQTVQSYLRNDGGYQAEQNV